MRSREFHQGGRQGADVTKLGTFRPKSKSTQGNLPDNVEVCYTANVALVGRLATFGERIMRAKAKEVGDQFTENLREKLKG